jgi:hypothetical protein
VFSAVLQIRAVIGGDGLMKVSIPPPALQGAIDPDYI